MRKKYKITFVQATIAQNILNSFPEIEKAQYRDAHVKRLARPTF